MSLWMILVSTILVNNFVLVKFLGICPFLGVSKKLDSALGMGIAVTFVMALAGAATWCLQRWVLEPLNLPMLQTLVFILVIAALVQFVEMVIRKISPPLYHALGVYLPLITTNCAVLGVTLLNVQQGYSLVQSLFSSVGCGLGFTLGIVLFSGVREHTKDAPVPPFLKGLPLTLLTAGLLSLAFLGFSGLS